MDDGTIYSLEGVGFCYSNQDAALENVSFSLQAGERVALLGSNGCGKSTLLKLMDGLLVSSSGSLRAFGVELNETSLQDEDFSPAFRQRVGFIFQRSDVQLFCPTVWDEIAFGPLQMRLDADEVRRRVDDVIELLGLGSLRERAPYHLSGGEQKKVAIASVLSINPQVLLLDEPTAALDPRTQLWFVDVLQKLQAAGKTTVVATHDIDLLPELADRALVLGQDHTIQRDGPVNDILSDHQLLHSANLAHHHLHRSVPPGAIIEGTQFASAHQHRGSSST